MKTPPLSRTAQAVKTSIIGELLTLAARPEVISFAGGLPSPEGFPVKALADAAQKVLEEKSSRALQYSVATGEKELKRFIAEHETRRGVPTTSDEVMIVSGSQQAIYFAAQAFVDEGSTILVEAPSYMGALQSFDLVRPHYQTLSSDEEGLNPAAIGEECRGARFAYVMPTFGNPSGLTISLERRKLLAEKARELDLWLIEDDPYGELWYDREPPISVRAFAPERTLRLGTFSKVLAPGLRLGYVCAPKEVIAVLSQFKQACDVHTSTLTQLIAAEVLNAGLLDGHLPMVRKIYKHQAEAMLAALEEFMPKRADISWTKPAGGMFIWVTLPETIDTTELMKKAVANNVAFVPGAVFYGVNPQKNKLRLSFVTVPTEKIRTGIAALAKVVKESL